MKNEKNAAISPKPDVFYSNLQERLAWSTLSKKCKFGHIIRFVT